MHAIGVFKGVALLEFKQERLEEQQEAPEQEVPARGVNIEDLLECPDHQPSSFPKGKPQSILSHPYFINVISSSRCLNALSYRSCLEPLDAYVFPNPEIYPESYVGLGSNICLVMFSLVEVG
jgi:hypothetical protein